MDKLYFKNCKLQVYLGIQLEEFELSMVESVNCKKGREETAQREN